MTATRKTSELPVATRVASTDRLVVLSGASGPGAQTSTITLSDLLGNSAALPVVSPPPSSSVPGAPVGAVMTDGDFLYVVTSAGVLKRVALSTF